MCSCTFRNAWKGYSMFKQLNVLWIGLTLCVGGLFSTKANALLLTAPNYTITFSPGWDTVQSGSIVAKSQGLYGIALLSCTPGTTAPNVDSLATFYADSLGGHITKGKDSALTLGKYPVKWQEFLYDSLPKLSAQISRGSLFPVSLKNGKFRVYYIVSNGLIFTVSELAIVTNGSLPNADIEAALKTLTLISLAGIREIAGTWGGAEMWIHDGRIGGAWFSAHRPIAIDCFNLRGAWIGSAKASGNSGIWTLPGVDRNAFLRILLADGARFHLPIGD